MKKLEKMDGKLFESLKPNEIKSTEKIVGGMKFIYLDSKKKYYVNGMEVDAQTFAWASMVLDAFRPGKTPTSADDEFYNEAELLERGIEIFE